MLIEASGGKMMRQLSKEELKKKKDQTIALVQRKQSGSKSFDMDIKNAKKNGFS